MSSDYEKILEADNARLTESIANEQSQIDLYKGYAELLHKGSVTNFRSGEDHDGWLFGSIIKEKPIQRLEIVIYAEDFCDFPLLHDKIDEYHRERRRMCDLQEEADMQWERRKKIILTTLAVVGVVALLSGFSWLIWAAYFVPL